MTPTQLTRRQAIDLNLALQMVRAIPGIKPRLRYAIHKNARPLMDEVKATLAAHPELQTTKPGEESKEALAHLLGEITLPLVKVTIGDLDGVDIKDGPEEHRAVKTQAIIEAMDPIIEPEN